MKPHLLHPSYLLWVVVPAIMFGTYHLLGLPHAIWSYEFHGSYTDFASRHYRSCTYIGPYGAFTVPATYGRCGWILFRKTTVTDQ